MDRMSKFDGIYYIHKNHENIGRIAPNDTINFSALKENANQMLISQYSKKWKASVGQSTKASKAAITLLGKAEDFSTESNKLFTEIDKQMKDKLQNIVNNDVLGKLHELSQTLTLTKFQEIVDKKNIEEISKLFTTLDTMLKTVDKENNLGLALLLNDFIVNTNDFKSLGTQLTSKLSQWRAANEGKTFTQQQIEQMNKVGAYLNNFAYVLDTGDFKSTGRKLTATGLSRLLVNGFSSTALAETFGIICNTRAKKGIKNAVVQAVGASQGKIIEGDEVEVSITNKTDISLPGVQIKVNLKEEGLDNAILNLNIGISNKFAKNNAFLNSNKQLSGTYSSGSGGKLGTALNNFGFTDRQKYLVYNYFAHGDNKIQEQEQLNDIILTKELLRLFSSANSSDFSQYMLINGRIISIWQLIQYVTQTELNKSSSQNIKQGLSLHISGREQILAGMTEDEAGAPENKAVAKAYENKNKKVLALGWHRSRLKNEDINNAKIEAKLHLFNLRKILN